MGHSTQCLWLKATPPLFPTNLHGLHVQYYGKGNVPVQPLNPRDSKAHRTFCFLAAGFQLPVVVLQKEPHIPSGLGCDALHHLSTC